jgi:hypothetical protein
MKTMRAAVALAVVLLVGGPWSLSSTAHAAASKGSRSPHSTKSPSSKTVSGHTPRSAEAKRDFMRQTGYPKGRPGYVVDHVIPLACGGADAPSNMQWQTVAEGKAKDKTERAGCR